MKFLRSIGLAALLMVCASSASAQVYYDMTQMTSQSGYRSEIYETVTTADFLRAPANGVQRLAFTRGSAFTATVYACETKTYAAGTCTSVATLSATNPSISITTGRAWLIVDVTAAETAGNVSYLTIRSHSTQHSSSGAVEVLIGNVGDVADTANPNDAANNQSFSSAVGCSDRCFFQASTTYGGGWWSWTGSAWSALNETQVWRHRFQGGRANWVTNTWDYEACIQNGNGGADDDDPVVCDIKEGSIGFGRKFFLTRWIFVPSDDSTTTSSCDIRILDGSSGPAPATVGGPPTGDATDANAITGTTWTVGGDVLLTEGSVHQFPINVSVTGGEKYVQFRNGGGGSICPAGASCSCQAFVDGDFQLLGVPRT